MATKTRFDRDPFDGRRSWLWFEVKPPLLTLVLILRPRARIIPWLWLVVKPPDLMLVLIFMLFLSSFLLFLFVIVLVRTSCSISFIKRNSREESISEMRSAASNAECGVRRPDGGVDAKAPAAAEPVVSGGRLLVV